MASPERAASGLSGLTVVSFESRRADDVARLIQRSGGDVLRAASMREVPLGDEQATTAFGERLLAGECDALVLLTGVGTRLLIDGLCKRWSRTDVVERLASTPLLCRGPKPVAALKLLSLRPTLVAPSPNTWRDLLAAMDQSFDVGGKRVYVQEYGAENVELMQGLRQRGAVAEGIGVYRWALPEDTSELEAALRRLATGEVDAAVFTSAHQVHNVLALAHSLGLDAAVEALRTSVVVASVGPVTSLALERAGIAVDLCPDSPKMGPLVVSLSRQARALCERKRAATPPVDLPQQRDNG